MKSDTTKTNKNSNKEFTGLIKKELAPIKKDLDLVKKEVSSIKKELKKYATKDDLKNFATKKDLQDLTFTLLQTIDTMNRESEIRIAAIMEHNQDRMEIYNDRYNENKQDNKKLTARVAKIEYRVDTLEKA